MFFLWMIVIARVMDNFSTSSGSSIQVGMGFVIVLYLGLGLIVFIDFITLGSLKKVENKWFSFFYSIIYTFFSYITLSFLYTPLLYNFLDNKYTRRLFFLSIPYILVILFYNEAFTTENNEYFPTTRIAGEYGVYISNSNYDDLRYKSQSITNDNNQHKVSLPLFSINQFELTESFLKIFIKNRSSDGESIMNLTEYDPYFDKGFSFTLFSDNLKEDVQKDAITKPISAEISNLRSRRRELRKKLKNIAEKSPIETTIDSINIALDQLTKKREKAERDHEKNKLEEIKSSYLDLYDIVIDQDTINSQLDCFFYIHPNAQEEGILCLYPRDSLVLGKHHLSITKSYSGKDETEEPFTETIPFYRAN